MSSARWPVVLFDLDGTVVNTIPLIMASYDHAMQQVLGMRADPVISRSWIGQTLIDTFSTVDSEKADELVGVYIEWNLANLERLVEPYPGIDDLVEALRAGMVNCGIVTAKRRESAEHTLKVVGLDGRLPLLCTMRDTVEHKPRPEPLLYALAQLGRTPAEAVYVGDAPLDIRAAKAAGMDSVAVTWGAGERKDLEALEPTALIDSVADLQRLLLGA